MTEKKFKISYYLFIVIFIIFILTGYLLYEKLFNKPAHALDVIPENSLFVAEITNIHGLIDDLSHNNEMWTALAGLETFSEIKSLLYAYDSSILKNHTSNELIGESKLYIAILPMASDSTATIYLAEKQGRFKPGQIENLIDRLYGAGAQTVENIFRGIHLQKVDPGEGRSPWYFTIDNGLLIAGAKPEGIAVMLKKPDGNRLSANPHFNRLKETAGKKVYAHIYLNLLNPRLLLAPGINSEKNAFVKNLRNFAQWCELDLIIKPDEILLNGYTTVSDSNIQFLKTFGDQDVSKIEMTNILPFNTNLLLWFGYKDFRIAYNAREAYLRENGRFNSHYNKVSSINNKYPVNVEKHLLSWVGSEAALLSLAVIDEELKERSYAVIRANNPVRANQLLTEMVHNIRGGSIIGRYKEHLIKKINLQGMIPMIFGQSFKLIENSYFTIINDYIVFANSANALHEFINTYLSGKTLIDNANYKDFSDNIHEEANLYLYYNLRNSLLTFEDYFSEPLYDFMHEHQNTLRDFQAIGIQFSLTGNMFYTNMYLRYNAAYKEESRAIWKTTLEAEVNGKPFLVKDHTDNEYNILVADELNQLYLIDNNGNILWKKQVDGKILSDIYPVDYYRNRKIQYLFNTENKIYLLDLLGRDVENYPIQLGTRATNGLALFDYVNDKDYRVVFAAEDNRIYNYDIEGNAVDGWEKPRTEDRVSVALQHIVSGNKDYIIIAHDNGKVKITDRRGDDRIKIREDFKNALNSEFYENHTNNKGVLLTTDATGHLAYIKNNGRTDETVFSEFGPDHYFLYKDLDKDGTEDFIYLDGNHLSVYDRFKNLMFEYSFEHEIDIAPVVFPASYRENLLGITSSSGNRIYLFDGQGKQIFSAGMVGETPFAVGSLNNNKDLNLVVGSGEIVYNYLLK